MANNKPEGGASREEDDREGLERYLKERPRLHSQGTLPRPKRKPSNRMLKPNGRTGSYETK